MELYASGENYLKAIFILQKQKDPVRSVDVAEYMGVSKPSVSHAVKMLRKGNLLEMREDRSLHLTELGQELGERLYERHQYFTERLTDAGVDFDTAKAEACRMEHTISDDSFKLLKEQKQKTCPFAASCQFAIENKNSTKEDC